MAPYASGSQIVRVAAAVIHGCDPLLPRRTAWRSDAQSLPYRLSPLIGCVFHEAFTIPTSKGLVNLVAAEPPLEGRFWAVSGVQTRRLRSSPAPKPARLSRPGSPSGSRLRASISAKRKGLLCRDPEPPSSSAELQIEEQDRFRRAFRHRPHDRPIEALFEAFDLGDAESQPPRHRTATAGTNGARRHRLLNPLAQFAGHPGHSKCKGSH